MVGAVSLLLIEPLTVIFYAIYLLCGVSDIVDGYIARKTNTVSKAGAALDSVADLILVIVMLVIFIPLFSWGLWLLCWIAIIAIIRFVSLGIGIAKRHGVMFLHTYANKATGIALFCSPLLFNAVGFTTIVIIMCCIASISSVEELLINLYKKDVTPNIRGLFIK